MLPSHTYHTCKPVLWPKMSSDKKTPTRFFVKLNFTKMNTSDIKTCSLCKKDHDKLLKPHDKVLGTQLSSVIKSIRHDQQLKFPQKFLICGECSISIVQTEILFKRLNDAFSSSKAEESSVQSKKIPEMKLEEENEPSDISRIDENDRDVSDLDKPIAEWIFKCRHCDYTTKKPNLYKKHLSAKHNLEYPRIYQCMYCTESYQRVNGIQNHIAYVHENKPRPQRQRLKTTALDTPPLMSSTKIGEQFKNDISLVKAPKVNKVADKKKFGNPPITDVTPAKATKVNKSADEENFKKPLTTDCKIKATKLDKAPKGKRENPLPNAVTDVKAAKVNKAADEEKITKPLKTDDTLFNTTKVVKSVDDSQFAYEFTCEHCEYKNISPKIFKNHLKSKHEIEESKIYKCKQCDCAYARQFALENHISYKHENKPRPLPQRRKSVIPDLELSTTTDKELLGLVGEIRHEEVENEFKCKFCAYETNNFKSLKHHTVIKHEIDSNNLNGSLLVVDEENNNEDDAPHQKSHNEGDVNVLENDWIFRCSQCTFESTKRKIYKTHMKTEHDSSDENIYKCIYCAGAYKRYNLLLSHVTNKHSINLTGINDTPPTNIESNQELNVNGLSTAKKRKNEDIKQTEQIVKRNKTEDIGGKAKQKVACVVCGKTFATIDKLRAHMDKNHAGDFIKHCTNCDAQFRSIEKYEEHLFTEKCLGIDSYACQHQSCTKIFNKLSKMKKHMLDKHPEFVG
ncbi:zinc finger protein indra-like [Eurosta solidaginis]|uniref:zinc finger protein indra-like n=1 Tax=Eurosta solidaginis TaxID=178769 RepID=UPI003530C8A4